MNVLHSTENSGSIKTNNITQRIDTLSQELHQISDNTSRDLKNMKLYLENMGKSMGNGVKTQELLNRLGEVSRRSDQLLLEQIQTDRKINLKLEVLQNDINILKTKIEANKTSSSQRKSKDEEKLNQLEERNLELEAKLQHLQTILTKNANLDAGELRKEIENDNELSVQTVEEKTIWEESKALWNKLVDSDGAKSSGVGITTKVICVFASAVTVFIYQMYRFS